MDQQQHFVQNIIRDMLGDVPYIMLGLFIACVGVVILIAAISDSNKMFGDPYTRDTYSMDTPTYLRTRKKLRIFVGVLGIIAAVVGFVWFVV